MIQGPKRSEVAQWPDKVLALTIVIVALTGISAALYAGASTPSSGDQVPVILSGEQTASDELPESFAVADHGDGGIDPLTTRLLGENLDTRYWIGRDRTGGVCLIAVYQLDTALAASSCPSPSEVERAGATLHIQSEAWTFDAFLVPDSIDTAALAKGWTAVSPNLLVSQPGSPNITLTRDPGSRGPSISLTTDPLP